MLNLTNEDIKNSMYLGSGMFSNVYKFDDEYAIKIYKEFVKESFDKYIPNPELKFKKFKLNRLIKLDKMIDNTDLVQDIVYVDGKFKGVKLHYYNGKLLNELMDEKFAIKVDYAVQLIKNSKQLLDFKIYPMDYKLNNIMLDKNNNVKIIDLDDKHTKVLRIPSLLYKKGSTYALADTIRTFFNESEFVNRSYKFKNLIDRKRVDYLYTYDDVYRFLYDRLREYNYVFIDKNSNVDRINSINNNKTRFIYVADCLNNKDNLKEAKGIIKELKNKNIVVFDMVDYSSIKYIYSNFYMKEAVKIDNDKILVKKI